ncbi:Flagellar basal body rod protein FlgB [Pseudovibrio sp. W64]|uniref:flagellar basal body rod protein FlgB n=1 Tax=unclassified Pseudovibrio TaxID=2627060 RepID=UPI0007B1EF09|nr:MULTISPECIES: flagellar basal body rod protein FlgB [unclassified Pseudovibrio]KZK77647.1 Flagellar basal body rod protein FlgB [Pseudovibrio sp. Ad46]KZK81375.1 Flagellar basal body rod protein FlgB [Pseudovibrio sp. Ad13]KZK83817.1 Flagellar basal body rod protein FlgB [Pseudovibrio sp. W64]KZK93518.1 Flagellar basal body rod protein FlgB [Pseudovibrio sp. Ad5]KZL23111.1 Flagellar basal body rod protein FlgB [Pseudovibrio sp. WM33]
MALTDLPMFQALRQKMQWHQQRQGVLAENVANADTPGYRSKDLKDLSFGDMVQAEAGSGALRPVATNAGHITSGGISAGVGTKVSKASSFERTPDGNSVVLEEQMMKIAENQIDYQTATSLYTRSLGMFKTALRR